MSDAAASPAKLVTVTPDDPAKEFQIEIPADFRPVELRGSEVERGKKDDEELLGMFTLSYAAIVFMGMAAPPRGHSNVGEWLAQSCKEAGMEVEEVGPVELAQTTAIGMRAVEPRPDVNLKFYVVAFEDGGTVYTLMGYTPVTLWETGSPILLKMIRSFRLAHPKGATMLLVPAEWQAEIEKARQAEEKAAAAAGENAAVAAKKAETPRPPDFTDFALSKNTDSFSPTDELNAMHEGDSSVRVPEVLEVNTEEQWALLDCRGIDALMEVPLGWHVTDNGKMVQVFDFELNAGIEFTWLDCEKNLDREYEVQLNETKEKHPALEHCMLDLGGVEALAMRGLEWKGKPFQQVIFLHNVRNRDGYLRVRASAAAENIERLADMMVLMVRKLRIG
jgi:hypothetical protein